MPQDPAHSMLAKIAAAMGGADPLSVAAAALGGLLIALVIVPNMPARRRIPGPFKLPVLGNAPVLASYASRGKALELFQLYFEKFGPLIALSVPGRTFLRTMDAALIHRALTDTDTFRKGEVAYKTAADLLGDALFLLPAGDRWRRHRKQLQPAFTPTQLRNAAPFIGRVADRLVDHLERLAGSAASGSAVVEIHAEFTALTFDVIGLVGFSFDCKATESLRGGQRSEIFSVIEDISRIVIKRAPWPRMLWGLLGVGPNSPRVMRVRRHLNDLFDLVIAEKHAAMARSEPKDLKAMDILDRLLIGADEPGALTQEEVAGEMIGFFFAGHETSANTLTFLVMELARHQDVQERLAAEIRAVLPTLKDGMTADNMHEFKYLDFVVKESQRLNPVIIRIGRETTREIEYNGFVIPAKMHTMLGFYEVQRDPKYWPEPERFNPDRWDGLKPHSGSFVPFGDGPMNCIGQKLALIEIKMALVKLVDRFQLALEPGQTLEFVSLMTRRLKHGLVVRLTPRLIRPLAPLASPPSGIIN